MSNELEPNLAATVAENVDDASPASAIRRRPIPMTARRPEFTKTKSSLVLRAKTGSPEALRDICDAYFTPLRAFARRIVFNPERADDVLYGFLTRVLENVVVLKMDATRGRFRTFLRIALRNYARNVHRSEMAEIHGGNAVYEDMSSDEIPSDAPTVDRLYDLAWAGTLLDRALERLREEQQTRKDRGAAFEALAEKLQNKDRRTLIEIATSLGKSEISLRLKHHRLKLRYRELIRDEIAATVAHLDEVDPELRDLEEILRDDDE